MRTRSLLSWSVIAVAGIIIVLPFLALIAESLWSGLLQAREFWADWLKTSHPAVALSPPPLPDGRQWQLPGAWGFHLYDVINSFLLVVTLLFVVHSNSVAEAALNKSHHSYVRSLVDARYDALDRLYFDLLRERRERRFPYHPEARERESAQGTGSEHPLWKVDPYPLMVWNFIETVVDKCEKDPSGELMDTWAPLISAEADNFGDFMQGESGLKARKYFKNDFMLLAQALVPASKKTLGDGEDLNGAVFLRLFRAMEKIKRSKVKFANDQAFLSCFEHIHGQPKARDAAGESDKTIWALPEDIRYDDLRNNEKRREDNLQRNYEDLVKVLLPLVIAYQAKNLVASSSATPELAA